MTLMYDSTNAAKIPTNAEVVAGYVDGEYAWTNADWERFPNAVKVRIAVFPWTNDGEVLDCENGDATPDQCPGWIRLRQSGGVAVPTIYCNLSSLAAVKAACQGLTYNLWIADPTGAPHLVAGSVATQYQWTSGYDLSLLSEGWPEALVPQVPQDYQNKFVLNGPYDWPGVVANLEGIIHDLQGQLANAAQDPTIASRLASDDAIIAAIKKDLGQ